MSYALRRDGETLARHPHRLTCIVEAIEKRLAVRDRWGMSLGAGVEIVPDPSALNLGTVQ